MRCDVGCRRSSDPTLLWLGRRLAAVAPIGPLAWDPPYVARAALKSKKKKKKKGPESKHVRLLGFLGYMVCTAIPPLSKQPKTICKQKGMTMFQ